MTSDTAGFRTVRFSQIATSVGRELILKEQPAVYAWYRTLRLGEVTGTPEKFTARIESMLSAKLSDKYSGQLGYLYEVSIQESGGLLGRRNSALLDMIVQDASARNCLASILELATLLQYPLYVGKSIDLRRRVGEHVTGGSGLLDRFEKAKIFIESCILRFKYINENDIQQITSLPNIKEVFGEEAAEATAVLVEELLTRLSPSAFVRRPG